MNQPALATVTPETLAAARQAVDAVFAGEQLVDFLRDIGLAPQSFYEALKVTPELSAAYASAKAFRAEAMASEVVKIADQEEDAQRARNRIQARQWYAAKILPREYGDRLDINVTQTIDIGTALQDARARALRPVCDQPPTLEAQDVDYKDVLPVGPADEQSNAPRLAQDPAPKRASLTARASQAAAPAPAKRGRRAKGAP